VGFASVAVPSFEVQSVPSLTVLKGASDLSLYIELAGESLAVSGVSTAFYGKHGPNRVFVAEENNSEPCPKVFIMLKYG